MQPLPFTTSPVPKIGASAPIETSSASTIGAQANFQDVFEHADESLEWIENAEMSDEVIDEGDDETGQQQAPGTAPAEPQDDLPFETWKSTSPTGLDLLHRTVPQARKIVGAETDQYVELKAVTALPVATQSKASTLTDNASALTDLQQKNLDQTGLTSAVKTEQRQTRTNPSDLTTIPKEPQGLQTVHPTPTVQQNPHTQNHGTISDATQWSTSMSDPTTASDRSIPTPLMTVQAAQYSTNATPVQWAATLQPAAENADSLEHQTDFSFTTARGETTLQHTQISSPARADLPHQIGRQIADAMVQMPNRPIEIALSPEELGRVRLTVKISDTGIMVNLVAERPETLDLMRRHIDQLGQDFQALGYNNIAFSFSDGDTKADTESNPQNTDASTFEDTDTPTDITQIELRSAATSGLDLRL